MLVAVTMLLHLVAAIIWIGGMFFAYMVVRPTAVSFDPPIRLPLWAGVFSKFFPWVWFSILFLVATGYLMVFGIFKGFGTSPWYVHYMHILALVMIVVFIYLYYAVYPKFKKSVSDENWPEAASKLNSIRQLVLTNLVLGLVLVAGVVLGKYT